MVGSKKQLKKSTHVKNKKMNEKLRIALLIL